MRASGYDRVTHDWYVEPAWAVEALLSVETLEGVNLDPCCGKGTIPKTIIRKNLVCIGSDIVDRGQNYEIKDFFTSYKEATEINNIVSNPPYGVIEPFITRALSIAKNKVAILARLALLESTKRQTLFQTTPLARVWVSSKRISMPPGNSLIKPAGGTIAYAWFVWEHGYEGKPTLGWF